MGADKASLRLPGDGRPLVRVLADRLDELFERVVVVARRPGELDLGAAVGVVDLPGRSDPLGAVATGLDWLAAGAPGVRWAFVCAVDMPGLHLPLVRALCERAAGAGASPDLLAPSGARGIEPLHAVWAVSAAERLLTLHDGGLRRLQALVDHLDVRIVARDALQEQGLVPPWALESLNTPERLADFAGDTSVRR